MTKKPLSHLTITKAEPGTKALYDTGGLYLLIRPEGQGLWQLKYRHGGRVRRTSLGRYPAVSLAQARKARDAFRARLQKGEDPVAERKVVQLVAQHGSGRSFEAVARDWHRRQSKRWTAAHVKQVNGRLEAYVYPALGGMDVDAITPPMVLAVCREIEARPAPIVARRVRRLMSSVFEYACACGLGKGDPAAVVMKALEPAVHRKMPAIINLPELVTMMREAEAQFCHPVTKAGLRFIALTAARPRMLRYARWAQMHLDGNAPYWHVPAQEMKLTRERKNDQDFDWTSPLSGPAVDVLRALEPLTYNGAESFIFPNVRRSNKPMSENTVLYLLNRTGYQGVHCAHGFRTSFSSIMNERHKGDHDAIEAQLAHTVPGSRGAYMRASFLERRAELLLEWAGLIMAGAKDAETLLLGPRRRDSAVALGEAGA